MSFIEQAELRGKRNRVEFLHALDSSITKSDNHTTQNLDVDSEIEKHRHYVMSLYQRHKNGETIKRIAKQEQLTETILHNLFRLVRIKLVRGIWQENLKPGTPQRFINYDTGMENNTKESKDLFNWE